MRCSLAHIDQFWGTAIFDLFRWDSAFGEYKNFNAEVNSSSEMPDEIKTSEELLRYREEKGYNQ